MKIEFPALCAEDLKFSLLGCKTVQPVLLHDITFGKLHYNQFDQLWNKIFFRNITVIDSEVPILFCTISLSSMFGCYVDGRKQWNFQAFTRIWLVLHGSTWFPCGFGWFHLLCTDVLYCSPGGYVSDWTAASRYIVLPVLRGGRGDIRRGAARAPEQQRTPCVCKQPGRAGLHHRALWWWISWTVAGHRHMCM